MVVVGRLVRTLLIVGTCGVLLAACGGGSQGGELGTYAGEVPNSELFIALGVDDAGQVLAYACDGNTVGEWFRGPLEGNQVAVTSSNGARLEATLAPDSATGTLTLGNQTLEFTAPPVVETGGLFRAEGEIDGQPSLTGWIVLDDGRQKGVTSFAATTQPAPELSARLVRRRVISPT